MRAMVLERPGAALVARDLPTPEPGRGDILVNIEACGVCRTDLHILDGDLPFPGAPVILGHEIVGRVARAGPGAALAPGQRVGVPWLAWTCGTCRACRSGQENLCDRAAFTGYTRPGGYAEAVVVDARFACHLADDLDAARTAPLLCAGLIGYRSYRMAGDAATLGFYGFGAAAHILVQIAVADGRRVFAFTRPGDVAGQAFARTLGASWAGDSSTMAPEALDAAIIFAPAGALVPAALRAVRKGGTVICAGIHMSDIPAFPYAALWGERSIRSVANLTRADAADFFAGRQAASIRTTVECFPLAAANTALQRLRDGRVEGAAVLRPGD